MYLVEVNGEGNGDGDSGSSGEHGLYRADCMAAGHKGQGTQCRAVDPDDDGPLYKTRAGTRQMG